MALNTTFIAFLNKFIRGFQFWMRIWFTCLFIYSCSLNKKLAEVFIIKVKPTKTCNTKCTISLSQIFTRSVKSKVNFSP